MKQKSERKKRLKFLSKEIHSLEIYRNAMLQAGDSRMAIGALDKILKLNYERHCVEHSMPLPEEG